jgi:Cu2+-exporting ATPase
MNVPKKTAVESSEPVLAPLPSVSEDDEELQSDSPIGLRYRIAHSVPGRLRLVIEHLKVYPERTSTALMTLANNSGISSITTNYWAGSAVINYDPGQISQQKVLSLVEKLAPAAIANLPAKRPSLVSKLLHGLMRLLDKTLPPFIQLGLGLGAFASAALGLPQLTTQLLLSASIAPIASRALRVGLEERKFGVDALDGCAATLMLTNGKVVEAAFMCALISLGEFIREQTARRCERMVNDLLGLSGRSAWLVKGKKRICVPAEEVKVGDVLVVYPGDMVPVDGLVIKGEAAIDQSQMTGESIPVDVCAGHKVMAATVAVEGKIYIRCEATGVDTKAARVLDSVASAPISETRIQNYASVVADRMVVPIFISAAICFGMTRNLIRLMSMLIFDFSTGIRIAAPTAVLASMHRAGQRGILIKSGGALEKLSTVNAIVFDKTGTLTSGEPKVTEVIAVGSRSIEQVLALAAAVEERLSHPASRAIVRHAAHAGVVIPQRGESMHMRGMGVKAEVNGFVVTVGSKRLMESESIDTRALREAEAELIRKGESVAYVAIDGELAGMITYSDKLRAESCEAIKQLKRLGVKKLIMATGDGESAASNIAAACGIDEVIARAFPEQKAELVKRLKDEGYTVGVIGDGINDSPALAHADVAISLHGGTEAARHSADIVLTDADLRRLPEAIKIARSSMGLVRQNLSLAVVPNTAGLGLAAFGMVGPAGATLLNNGSAICAALNSLRPLFINNWSAEKEGQAVLRIAAEQSQETPAVSKP